ncbi:MAG: AAHS family 4-hydroxybenzoate transporter-like MFS transporter [Limisphaerales bacterium]|jgi:AAHS family 4-hydroxybenzoate transporter-like MFS transporter
MPTTETVADLIDQKVSARQIIIVGLCLIFNMVDGFDITAMAVTAHQIGEEMQLGADTLGLVFSFSLAGMMMGAMFIAPLSDIIGRRTMIIFALFVVGTTVFLTAQISTLPVLIGLRFISGLGAGAMLASVATLAAEYMPERFRALAVTAVTAGYPLGAMLTGLTAGAIIPEFGWRGMFLAGGSITLVLAVIAYFFIPESLHFLASKKPNAALAKVNKILTSLARPEVAVLPAAQDAGITDVDNQNVVEKMLSLLTPELRRSTLILWSAFFLCISTLYFLMSWVPKLIIDLGYDAEVGNTAFTLFNFGGVLGIFALGSLATRWTLTTLITFFTVSAAVLMWVFAAVAASDMGEWALLTLIFIIGFGLQGGFTGMYAVAAKIYPAQVRGTGVGWAIGLGRFGAVVGPGIAGYMIAAGLSIEANFLVFAIPLLIGGLLAYQLKVS